MKIIDVLDKIILSRKDSMIVGKIKDVYFDANCKNIAYFCVRLSAPKDNFYSQSLVNERKVEHDDLYTSQLASNRTRNALNSEVERFENNNNNDNGSQKSSAFESLIAQNLSSINALHHSDSQTATLYNENTYILLPFKDFLYFNDSFVVGDLLSKIYLSDFDCSSYHNSILSKQVYGVSGKYIGCIQEIIFNNKGKVENILTNGGCFNPNQFVSFGEIALLRDIAHSKSSAKKRIPMPKTEKVVKIMSENEKKVSYINLDSYIDIMETTLKKNSLLLVEADSNSLTDFEPNSQIDNVDMTNSSNKKSIIPAILESNFTEEKISIILDETIKNTISVNEEGIVAVDLTQSTSDKQSFDEVKTQETINKFSSIKKIFPTILKKESSKELSASAKLSKITNPLFKRYKSEKSSINNADSIDENTNIVSEQNNSAICNENKLSEQNNLAICSENQVEDTILQQNILSDIKENSVLAKTSEYSAIPSIRVESYDFLIGKSLTQDLKSYSDQTLAHKGSIIDNNLITLSKNEGKLIELALISK